MEIVRKDKANKKGSNPKNFILDTNVLLYDPQALFQFEENNLYIPITVIEEIDRFKKNMDETGRNARQVSRILDSLRDQGQLASGVELPDGGTLRVVLYRPDMMANLPPDLHGDKADNLILAVAMHIRNGGKTPTKLITKDTNLRIKADTMNLHAEDYEHGKIAFDELYSGLSQYLDNDGLIGALNGSGNVSNTGKDELSPNQGVLYEDSFSPSISALGRFDAGKNAVVSLNPEIGKGVWGIRPRNNEQSFAFDLLLNDEIQIVTLVGKAGTGKTLLALAAGMQKTAEENVYNRLLVSRPVFPMGKDLGFLPGDIQEKLSPWMQPIFDNVDLLLREYGSHDGKRPKSRGKMAEKSVGQLNHSYKELIDMGLLEIEPLTYIRGRSLPNQFLIVDEAQNLTPHEVKTILTRAGEGTKVVLTGDPYQIDNPYVDASSNGLTYVVEKFRKERISGHITLNKGERSALAELAANLL
ncbi:MAG TPA: PhoH family protein [Geobacteraceae bacterium]|nr:PhoH family protein [Geobacteraceae bacterium]